MLIIILKFFHVIIVLGLVGLTLYCFSAVGSKRFSTKLNKQLIYLSIIAIITGTFLVYPRHFTFHTPWIQAAYIFTMLFAGIVFIMAKKNKLSLKWQRIIYLFLVALLFTITHDAVTKSTIIPAFLL